MFGDLKVTGVPEMAQTKTDEQWKIEGEASTLRDAVRIRKRMKSDKKYRERIRAELQKVMDEGRDAKKLT